MATQTPPAPKANAAAKPVETKPGSPAPAAKKEKPKRVAYPGLNPDAEGKTTTKLENWPTDFDSKTHKPLRRSDFTSEAPFLDKRADQLEAAAKRLRSEAEEARKLGNTADRAKAKKLRSMIEKVEAIKAELLKQGLDPAQFLPQA